MLCENCADQIIELKGDYFHAQIVNHWGGAFSKLCHQINKKTNTYCDCKKPEPKQEKEND